MATMAGLPQSAAQLMFLPFFNGAPFPSLAPLDHSLSSGESSANNEKVVQLNHNHNNGSIFPPSNLSSPPLTSSMSSFQSELKLNQSEVRRSSTSCSSADDTCGNAPLNLTKPKCRTNHTLSSSATIDTTLRPLHDVPLSRQQPPAPQLISHDGVPSALFAENPYWNALTIPAHLRKTPFGPVALHSSGLELIPPIDTLNLYLNNSNANASSLSVSDGAQIKKDNFHGQSDHTERKSDSVITCQSNYY